MFANETMANFTITVGTTKEKYFKRKTLSHEINDIEEFVFHLGLKLLGVRITYKLFPVNHTLLKNGSFSGLIGATARNEVGISFSNFNVVYERFQAVDFSLPYIYSDLKFVTNTGESRSEFLQLLKQVDWKIWISVLFSMAALAVALSYVTELNNKNRRKSVCDVYLRCCWQLFGSVLNKGVVKPERSTAYRLLLASWWLFVMPFSIMNSSTLTSHATVKSKSVSLDTPAQLADALSDTFWVSVRRGTFEEMEFKDPHTSTYDRIAKYCKSRDASIREPECLELGLCAVLITRRMYDRFHSKYHLSEGSFRRTMTGALFPKLSPFREPFDQAIERLMEVGLLMKVKRQILWNRRKRTSRLNDREEPENLDFYTLEHLLLVLYLVSIGFLVLEQGYSRQVGQSRLFPRASVIGS